jgi:hypothetical protein
LQSFGDHDLIRLCLRVKRTQFSEATGSQVQILPLRPNKSRKIGRFLQRPESSPRLPGLLSGPKLGAAISSKLDCNHRRALRCIIIIKARGSGWVRRALSHGAGSLR